ncbi:MAG TPA: hypothetical protein VJ063_06065, partial [Verrucomicrobiae bacterium]|nr:hypothetical protein [Verrucomicrobiae bacterium]
MSHRIGVLAFFALGLQFGFTQAISVIGVNDRSDNVDAVSFVVPADPGFSYMVLLDGKPVPAGVTNRVTKVDYHEIFVLRTNVTTQLVATRLVRFVIMSSNRGTPERGLIEWTPYPLIPSANAEYTGATLQLMTPADYPAGMDIPIIARVAKASGDPQRVNGTVICGGHPSFRILRGHGSGFMTPGVAGNPIEYDAQLGPLGVHKDVNIDAVTTWTPVSGILSANTDWPANSRIHITGNLTIPLGTTLTIGAGTVVRINPLINITNSGRAEINGTVDHPVVFTSTNAAAVLPERPTYAWGGFFMRGGGAQLIGNGCIFVGGGGNTGISFSPGSSHKSEQAVFLVHSGARMSLTNCAVINTAGQVANGYSSDITYDHCHFQRAITGGESVGGTIIVNHSAIIEFPEDNGFNNAALADGDYDGIYFTTGTHLIYNSLIGFCKDDAIDSGSGGAGTVLVTNCWIESALHEANAWSGEGRVAEDYGSVLINCGQGFECGWSTGSSSPLTYGGNILSIGNSIGARFGDNYDTIGPFNGLLRVTNSFLLYNYRDVWGMNWRNDSTGWYYRSNQMDIRDNFLSQPNSFHPTNTIWNGAQDGWRLARFMTTPPNAPVGIGFATWSNTLPASRMFDGIPVRLSSFTTNAVQVDYGFQSPFQTVHSGTLIFAPGETVKRIFPYGFDARITNLRLVLANPVGGDLTGNTNIQFQGVISSSVPNPVFGYKSQHDYARVVEGYPLGLSAPAGYTFTAGYEYRSAGGILSTGLITFPPGETLAWAPPPPGNLANLEVVQFVLRYPVLPAAVTAYYLRLPSVGSQGLPTTLIARGSTWKYPNVAGQLDASWKTAAFNDSAWLSGPTELGFGDGDEARAITKLGSQITYYFRKIITIPDPNAFSDLALWMRRDDGAVLHFNGSEVFRSSSMPSPPTPITFTTLAVNQGDNAEQSGPLARTGLIAGDNVIAVEIHQDDAGSSDISFNMELIGNPAPQPPRMIILRYGSQLLAAWNEPSFGAEQADSPTGPWSAV